jgi:hypothetical protein
MLQVKILQSRTNISNNPSNAPGARLFSHAVHPFIKLASQARASRFGSKSSAWIDRQEPIQFRIKVQFRNIHGMPPRARQPVEMGKQAVKAPRQKHTSNVGCRRTFASTCSPSWTCHGGHRVLVPSRYPIFLEAA